MSIQKKINARKERRALRSRKRVKHAQTRSRVSVFRSLSQIYAQIIDDVNQRTVVSCSSLELKNLTGDKKAVARSVGLELAKRAKDQGINEVVFDRGSYLYHGRVQELAQGLRDGGLTV